MKIHVIIFFLLILTLEEVHSQSIGNKNKTFNKIEYYVIDRKNLYLAKVDGYVFKEENGVIWKKKKVDQLSLKNYPQGFDGNILTQISNSEGVPIYVPKGSYQFLFYDIPEKGFSGPGRILWKNNIIYDPSIKSFGIPQNINEERGISKNSKSYRGVRTAPISNANHKSQIDILAHWYNDFGLERTIGSSSSKFGSSIWYDWSWNFSSNENYDPSRHPLLGWYKGDDPVILDWICYWLHEYGIKGVVLTNNFSTNDWENPKSYSYWYFQLFTNVQNFKKLKYVPWLTSSGVKTVEEAKVNDTDLIQNVIKKYPNIYLLPGVKGRYPVLYIWDMELFRGLYDNYNGNSKSVKRLSEIRDQLREMGYDGVVIFARNLKNSFDSKLLDELAEDGIHIFSQDYSSTYNIVKRDNTYKNYVNNVKFPVDKRVILNVMTSAESSEIHPSNWDLKNSNPDLFSQVLKKAIYRTKASNKPPVVVIYNVSEWAEGGPSLIPSVKYKFGYLEAIRKNLK